MSVSECELADARAEIARLQAQVMQLIETETLRVAARDARIAGLDHVGNAINLQIARVAHETNAAFCRTIGDDSQPTWEDAPEWQRQSAIKGVEFHLREHASGRQPSASAPHECWLAEKYADGWKSGPFKDPAKKEHPCCVPYGDLPLNQRMKDYLFGAIVAAFFRAQVVELNAALAGKDVSRG